MRLWLLVGRGGSRGVVGKNLRRIGGCSLIEWKIRAARACDPDAVVVCSSDSPAIRDEAMRCGATAVIIRPPELATDTATTADVVRHALGAAPPWEQVVLQEPSAPFTTASQYREALAMMSARNADLVVGMKQTEPHTAFIGNMIADDPAPSINPIIHQFREAPGRRRQDYGVQWTMSGSLYVFSTAMFMRTGDVYGGSRNYGLLVDRWTGLEIDTLDDLEMAEYAYARGKVRMEGAAPVAAGEYVEGPWHRWGTSERTRDPAG